MAEDRIKSVEFLREQALRLAGPYSRSSDAFSALVRAADALREAAIAVRHEHDRR